MKERDGGGRLHCKGADKIDSVCPMEKTEESTFNKQSRNVLEKLWNV